MAKLDDHPKVQPALTVILQHGVLWQYVGRT